MYDLENKCISTLPFQLPFYFRYVDDIITAVPSDEITTIKNIFNSYNLKIQFTVEEESDNRICFLDVLFIRNGKYIQTNWYQKPIWSGRFLHYHSHHPLNYKINVINNLVDSGITLSDKKFHKENIQKIKSTLLKNNYPLAFLNSVIKKRLNLLSQRGSKTNAHTHEVSERVPNTHIRTHAHTYALHIQS